MAPRGGSREGAGRPFGGGKYKEPTKPIRIPESVIPHVMHAIETQAFKIPLYSTSIRAGFPSQADDHIEKYLDLNTYLIKNPAATFFLRVGGDSMINAGIHENDILIVDKSLSPSHGKIVIAVIDGELTVKRLYKTDQELKLVPENEKYPVVIVNEDCDFRIWGVVTGVIHHV